jgi:hypothetical protein
MRGSLLSKLGFTKFYRVIRLLSQRGNSYTSTTAIANLAG